MENWLGMAAENSLTNVPCCSMALSEQSLCLRAVLAREALAMSLPFLVCSSLSP